MSFIGALQTTTATATTISATSVVATPGTFRIGGTVGTTLKSLRWNTESVAGVNPDAITVYTVTLSPAMPDTTYIVFATPSLVNNFLWSAFVDNKTTTSFDLRLRKRGATGTGTVSVDWVVIDF